jgi:hypothetical protein
MRKLGWAVLCTIALSATNLAGGQASAQTTPAPNPATAPPAAPARQARVIEQVEPWQDRALDAVTARGLETFASEGDFRRYLQQVRRIRRERTRSWQTGQRRSGGAVFTFAQDAAGAQDVCANPEDCPAEDNIVVTSARAAPVQITNVQTAGVDEGDVVKQIGDFLLVLQDGRIFSVNTRGDRLELADRIDVYRNAQDDDAWYDEMLVQGNRVLITAYNYGQDATEISVFRLNTETGALARDGSFLISSEDYYDTDNYATRIIGDNLIIYTPYDASDMVDRSNRPRVRRWMSEAERDALEERGGDARAEGRDLIDANAIYRPVLRTSSPTIHTVTICPLGDYRATRVPNCRATAFVGPEEAEMFVSPTAVYLWVGMGWDDRRYTWGNAATAQCPGGGRAPFDQVRPAAVFRVPVVRDGEVGVIGLRGRPSDQFSMDETRGVFRTLVSHSDAACRSAESQLDLAYLNIPLDTFDADFRQIGARRHVAVPSPGPGALENRFAGDWLVYGGRLRGYGAIPDPAYQVDQDGDGRPDPVNRSLTVLPVANPENAQSVEVAHNVIRLERVGETRMAVNGYRNHEGLSISLLQLGPQARILDTAQLHYRYESEGRSHAFNAITAADGSGMIGIPTVARQGEAWREWWRSEGSDVSFLTFTAAGRLADAGPLLQGQREPGSGYTCEVSCIDWYGNSRPIFTDGRIFALMATEIAEGRLDGGRIREVRRVDLTRGLGTQR